MFKNREEAGRLLGEKLAKYKNNENTIVVGIPRGGVQVAYFVATALNLPLNIIGIKKIGFPGNSEYAIGATSLIDSYIDQSIVNNNNISQDYINQEIERKKIDLNKAYKTFGVNETSLNFENKIIILVDDGAATGATMFMAAQLLKKQAKKIIIALPVASVESLGKLKLVSDEIVCLSKPADLNAIGQFYLNFDQVENEQVKDYLEKTNSYFVEKVVIPVNTGVVEGDLIIPAGAKGIIIFAYGSGSSRFSPREQFVAKEMQKSNFGTFLMDLLTKEEEIIDDQTMEYRFNIELLAERLISAVKWLDKYPVSRNHKFGYFGASTGAAAVLIATAKQKNKKISALVLRGGRPDLAIPYLKDVNSPVLMIVGENDTDVIELNKKAKEYLSSKANIKIIPGATHLFEEPGALEKVAELSINWFKENIK